MTPKHSSDSNPQDHPETKGPPGAVVLAAPSQPPVTPATPVTYEAFSDRYDRCFDRVWAYVSNRTGDRTVSEQIVARVLENNLTLLVSRGDSTRRRVAAIRDLHLLKAACDRLIGESKETPLSSSGART